MNYMKLESLSFKTDEQNLEFIELKIIYSSKIISDYQSIYYISGFLGQDKDRYLIKFSCIYTINSYKNYINQEEKVNEQINDIVNHLKEIIYYIYEYIFDYDVTSLN